VSDVVLSVPVNAGGVDPLLASLEKINENLKEINLSSKGSFDLFAKSIDKSNKKLKETDKTFGDIFKKIKLSGLMKMGAGVIGAGAGLLGISTGAMLFGALRNAGGNIGTGYRAKGLNMSTAEMKALEVASKVTTGKEDTLITALDSLTTAMRTTEGQTAITSLGLNVAQLMAMNPEDALQAVFDAVKGKGTGIGFQNVQEAFSQVTGLSDKDYAIATKQGAAFESPYNEFLAKFGDVDWAALAKGSESMVKFQSQLDIISSKLGSKLADPLAKVLDKLTPWLDKFGDWLGDLIGSITQEQVDAFMKNIQTVFDFVAGMAQNIANPEKAAQEAVDARNKAFKEGNVGAALGYDAKALGANIVAGVTENIGYAINPEARARKQLEQKEPFLRDLLRDKGRQFTKEQWGWLEQLGYIKGGQLTEKAQALKIEIIVKDPAGNVLSSAIQTQSKPTPYIPTRTASTKKGG
jgi:hypothetical protein